MPKPRWQRILELEEPARSGSGSSSEAPPLPPQSLSRHDPAVQQMAADVAEIRRKQSIEFYAPDIAVLVLIAIAWWILHV
jgi:hypothetical protein